MIAARTISERVRRAGRAWRITAIVVGALVLALAAGALWALTPLGPEAVALDELRSDRTVKVTERSFGYVFEPVRPAPGPAAGFIMYPGGHVDLRSYASLCRLVAARGSLVILVRMPLSLAVLGSDRATRIVAAYPRVKHWTIGGHSLGGAMAAGYAANHLGTVQGLVMLASYPPADVDLRASRLAIAVVRGERDGVLDEAAVRDSRSRLPETTVWLTIPGGNHAGFGDYGRQPGDGEATIPPAEQQQDAAAAIASVIGRTLPAAR